MLELKVKEDNGTNLPMDEGRCERFLCIYKQFKAKIWIIGVLIFCVDIQNRVVQIPGQTQYLDNPQFKRVIKSVKAVCNRSPTFSALQLLVGGGMEVPIDCTVNCWKYNSMFVKVWHGAPIVGFNILFRCNFHRTSSKMYFTTFTIKDTFNDKMRSIANCEFCFRILALSSHSVRPCVRPWTSVTWAFMPIYI